MKSRCGLIPAAYKDWVSLSADSSPSACSAFVLSCIMYGTAVASNDETAILVRTLLDSPLLLDRLPRYLGRLALEVDAPPLPAPDPVRATNHISTYTSVSGADSTGWDRRVVTWSTC